MEAQRIMFATLILALGLQAQGSTPDWHTPTPVELQGSKSPKLVKSDFDGDGKADTAQLMVSNSKNLIGLFVSLSSKGYKPLLVAQQEPKAAISYMGLGVAKPGTYATACGKGYFECRQGEPESFTTKLPGLSFFVEESTEFMLVWSQSSGSFQRHQISD